MEPVGVALIGCGTVGSGVAKLLLKQPERLAARAGRPLQLRRVVVRDANKARGIDLPAGVVTTNINDVLNDPSVQIAVEVVGGIDWAKQMMLQLLKAGKDVVTANKALLAQHGREVFDAGRRHGRCIAFEASVAGGIPIIAAITQSLTANQIVYLQGILNGTCNYILTGMTEGGKSYEDMLAEAQKLGYAEADPTMDVDGTDTAHKLAILAQIAFGVTVPIESIPRRGIANLQQADIRYAGELGYTIKLLAEAWLHDNRLSLHVSPVLLHKASPTALVREAFNAINVVGDAVGNTLFYGRGAGQMPTASAVVADIIDIAVGRAQRTFQTLRLWSGETNGITLRPPGEVRSRYYLRLTVVDRHGVLAEVARVLAKHQISISSVIQHEATEGHEGQLVPLVIMTHTVATANVNAAMTEIGELGVVARPSVFLPVED